MRLWTLHPKYLDRQGLLALWREALLAQKVLQDATRGYRHHPQLERFRASPAPLSAIAIYLAGICDEATRRGYVFDCTKIPSCGLTSRLITTEGQLRYEWGHLQAKLRQRSPALACSGEYVEGPEPHPLFRVVPGPIAPWERVPAAASERA